MFNSEKLMKWLDEHNVTQYRFARMTGLEQSTISRIISGLVDPNSRTIARICQATGLSPDEVIIIGADLPLRGTPSRRGQAGQTCLEARCSQAR